MSSLLESVEASIKQHRLIDRGESCVIAVSGGLDSMVLLHVLHQLATKYHWRLSVAHFNHRLRGVSSNADERFVRKETEARGLPFLSGSGPVRELARWSGDSIEMWARTLRHEFFLTAALQFKAAKVALAHHADDQVELFFLRLLRGSGGEGLAGMKWKGPSPRGRSLCLVRPLLAETKEALRTFAVSAGIRFREDASNQCLTIQRNWIRHKFLPSLRKQYPALNRTVLRSAEILGAEADYVISTANQWLERLNRPTAKPFNRLPVAVQRRAIQIQLQKLGVLPRFDLIESLRLNPSVPVVVPKPGQSVGSIKAGIPRKQRGIRSRAGPRHPGRVIRDALGMVAFAPEPDSGFNPGYSILQLDGNQGKTTFSGIKIQWKISQNSSAWRKSPSGVEVFDAEQVGREIVFRHWRPGDRFQPIGMKRAVKLQDFFTNEKIDRSLRRNLIIAQTAQGEVFWVEGLRIAEQFKVTGKTIRRLNWHWERL